MKRANGKGQRADGFVLVVVLCFLIMLTAMLVVFNRRCLGALRGADNLYSRLAALNYARAGVSIALAVIGSADVRDNRTLRRLISSPKSFSFDGGRCTVSIAEEAGKLNVNLLKGKNGRLNRHKAEQLLRLIEILNHNGNNSGAISYAIVPAIADWTDGDDSTSCLEFISGENTGVESDYYEKLYPAYKCPNTELQNRDELLLVKGITEDVFGRLCDYVTVYGDGKVNINTASKTVIQALSGKMDSTIADMIVRQRKGRAFDSISQLRNTPAMTDELYNQIRKAVTVSTDEPYYEVKSEADCNGYLCIINAIIKKDRKTGNFQFVVYKES